MGWVIGFVCIFVFGENKGKEKAVPIGTAFLWGG